VVLPTFLNNSDIIAKYYY